MERKAVFNIVSRKYIEVLVDLENRKYVTPEGESVLRIQTKGKTGTTNYKSNYYLTEQGKETSVFGMGGSTGHGWGGRVIGFALESEVNHLKWA